MSRGLLLVLGIIFTAVAFYASRPPPITSEAASDLLATCLQKRLESCSIKDDTSWEVLAQQAFRLSSLADPQFRVANYEFVSRDRRFVPSSNSERMT